MDIIGLVNPKYVEVFKKVESVVRYPTEWAALADLAYTQCLVDGWESKINALLSREHHLLGFKDESEKQACELDLEEEYLEETKDKEKILYLVADIYTPEDISVKILQYQVDKIWYVLPHKRKGFAPHIRLLTDVILEDAYVKRCTDIHFRSFINDDGSTGNDIQFREGIDAVPYTKFKITNEVIEDIIRDTVENRSAAGSRLASLAVDSAIKYRMIDERYGSRCEVAKSIVGKTLNIRLLTTGSALDLSTLSLPKPHTDMWLQEAKRYDGLALVGGVFGSGKGTTLNAVVKEISKAGNMIIASLDDPTEYTGQFNQFEYTNAEQMTEYIEAFKKMDLNAVFLNEIINVMGADAVYDLTMASIHTLTTLHVKRVYNSFYRMDEFLPGKYLNLIPFINVLSYQDKFSKTCPHCTTGVSIDLYEDGTAEREFLEAFKLKLFKQPVGCSKCENTKKLRKGIKVLCEHIELNDKLKTELRRASLHEQSDILKREVFSGESLEKNMYLALEAGEILVSEALLKIDTWKGRDKNDTRFFNI